MYTERKAEVKKGQMFVLVPSVKASKHIYIYIWMCLLHNKMVFGV